LFPLLVFSAFFPSFFQTFPHGVAVSPPWCSVSLFPRAAGALSALPPPCCTDYLIVFLQQSTDQTMLTRAAPTVLPPPFSREIDCFPHVTGAKDGTIPRSDHPLPTVRLPPFSSCSGWRGLAHFPIPRDQMPLRVSFPLFKTGRRPPPASNQPTRALRFFSSPVFAAPFGNAQNGYLFFRSLVERRPVWSFFPPPYTSRIAKSPFFFSFYPSV